MDVIIGLECHVELNTKTKLFCGCTTKADEPNTATCDICAGFPGSKPVVNKKALDYALKLCLALECTIAPEIIFSRKTYFYPDMGKNFQITQYEVPLGSKGSLQLEKKKVDITRIHVEEDPAALVHQGSTVLVDYNRSGHALCELVTEPQLSSPEEAREFLKRLITILEYLQIFDVKDGVIKADANISIKGFERVEIKNITGFKEIERALHYEILRQQKLVSEGQGVKVRETRGWDSTKGITLFQRSKEEEADYGYIMEPDLVPIEVSKAWIDKVKKELPELPQAKAARYVKAFKIKREDADAIANDYEVSRVFENAIVTVDPLVAAEWIRREVARVLNYSKKVLSETFIEKNVIDVLELLVHEKITRQTGQRLMELLVEKDVHVKKYVQEKDLLLVQDTGIVETISKRIVKENPKVVADYKGGNEKALYFLVGLVMRESKGKSDPKKVGEIIKRLIK